MKKEELKGYLEFASCLSDYELRIELPALVEAADKSQIHTFGWPIGVVLHNNEEFKPKPISSEKIRAVIQHKPSDEEQMFDYWTLERNGNYYILKSLFEDTRDQDKLFFDTRIVRTTELLLRTGRLYIELGVPEEEIIECRIEYGGLLGRVLSTASQSRYFIDEKKCTFKEASIIFQKPVANFLQEETLKEMVFETIKTITQGFDFFVPSKSDHIDPRVENFLKGRIS